MLTWTLFICAFNIPGECEYIKTATHTSISACIEDSVKSSIIASQAGYSTLSTCMPKLEKVSN